MYGLNFLILQMAEPTKTIQNIFNNQCNIDDLISSAHLLLGSNDEKIVHDFLEIGHLPMVNRLICKADKVNEWFHLLHRLILQTNFNVYSLIKQRVLRYEDKALFQTISGNNVISLSYNEVWEIVQSIGSFFHSNLKDNNTVGILTPNNINGVLIDLACLAYGIRVVPIPINVSPDHLNYVLNHAEITHLFTGSDQARELLAKAKRSLSELNSIQIDNNGEWQAFLDICKNFSIINAPTKDNQSLATIMYTSGTTDNPKGIIFNHENIISKRFARALALPEIGPRDRFLCYLPLYHTFGRWFEMMGAIFWGTTYTFTESTSFKTLLRDFKTAQPSVFISIPKRWIQIQEQVAASISIEESSDEEITKVTVAITGGKLKWGLSAAGYLDPDIFKFFHQNGINLLSGYGMTEATGGITMTPPNDYMINSVGKRLPGIELKLGNDYELLMRGPYVTSGYYKDANESPHTDGWLHSGDIFKEKKGHYFIVDRKKEIYKNSRGQTISPQKIENLFQDFEAIHSVFLVGDGKEFNTLLLYPDPENNILDLPAMTSEEIRTYFSSLVFSVNTFLPSYERIVNYAIISRNFDHDHNELTPKNTYRRKNILKHFADIIHPMYEKNYISLIQRNYEIQIPNWLLREKRLTRSDIRWDGKSIREYDLADGLVLKWTKSALTIGDFSYHTTDTTINFEKLLKDPTLWLGNSTLTDFIGEVGFRVISFEPYHSLSVNHLKLPFNQKDRAGAKHITLPEGKQTLASLHLATENLFQKDNQLIKSSLDHFKEGLNSENYQTMIQDQLLRLQAHPNHNIWRWAFEILIPYISGKMFANLYRQSILNGQADAIASLDSTFLKSHHLKSILECLTQLRESIKIAKKDELLAVGLISFIAELGIKNPQYFVQIRGELTLWMLVSQKQKLAKLARTNRSILINEFRSWITNGQSEADFNWNPILQFDQNIPNKLRTRIEQTIRETTLIRESTFIFSKGSRIQLNDIANEGVWVSFLGKGNGKHVVRVLVQLKDGKAYNFVININEDLEVAQFKMETNWLISMGSSIQKHRLVEDFGAFWPERQVYTEEYIPGETVLQFLERKQDEISTGAYPDRWQMQWLHFIWNGAAAYFEFWKRTGCTRMVADASPKNVMIPEFDYYVGTRLVSISGRKKVTSLKNVLLSFYEDFILKTEKRFPGLKKMADWEILFTVTLEVFGTKIGSKLLRSIKITNIDHDFSPKRVKQFLAEVESTGLLRKQVVFASLRYQRWLDLNPEATHKARGIIIQDLYKDYKLQSLIERSPETRIRFFLMTAFKDSNLDLLKRLNDIMIQMRSGSILEKNLETNLHYIHDEIDLTDAEKYFLTRLVFEHVGAADYAELITRDVGKKGRLDLVVFIENKDSQSFKIRPPFHPKEVARFHKLLLEAKLDVQFESRHDFLFIMDKKDHLAGGVFWKKTGPRIAHLEKIAIAPHYQNSYLSIRLAEELFNRLKLKKFEFLTVGFFQSGLFYKLGFEIDQKFSGLVKRL